MSNFKVLWSEAGSDERQSRGFESALEARGFIKGLRAGEDLERIAIRILKDGAYEHVRVAHFFQALEAPGRGDRGEAQGEAAGLAG